MIMERGWADRTVVWQVHTPCVMNAKSRLSSTQQITQCSYKIVHFQYKILSLSVSVNFALLYSGSVGS